MPALLIACGSCALAQPSGLRTHTQVVPSGSDSFVIEVGGTIDPENVEITVENAGETPVKNPRITVNGRYDWYTLEGMVGEITRGAATDQEKAMAIFAFVARESYWWSYPKDRTSLNPVRHFNIYGYHICSQAAAVFVALCRAAGVEARVYEIWHHTVAEARWDGQWHHLDPDLETWYLKDDNKTIASMAELEAHPEWVARSYKPYRWYLDRENRKVIYKPEGETAGKDLADIYGTSDDNYVETGYDQWMYQPQSMDFTLRPDEKLVRWWKPVLSKHYDQAGTHEPPRYANGRMVFAPDFTRRKYADLIQRRNVAFQSEDGIAPAVHVARPQDALHDRPSSLRISIRSPYVIVGGFIDSTYYKGGTFRLDQVSLAADLDPVLHQPTPLWNFYSWAYGKGESRAVLDRKLVKDGPVAAYQISAIYTLSADKRHEGPAGYPLVYGGQSGLDRVVLSADLQVNPGSLPALSLGKNTVRYTDETPGEHRVQITYRWRERSDQHPPSAPGGAEPGGGARVGDLAPRLSWAGATDADGDRIVNYRVQVCLRPDCAWPVTPTLDRDVRQGTSFQLPKGWLNPATSYYWRVRAEDEQGNPGPWSAIQRFTTP